MKHYFTAGFLFKDEEHALENDLSVLGLLLCFSQPLWDLLLLEYLSAHFTNHLANINILDKYLLMPFLCWSLSKVALITPYLQGKACFPISYMWFSSSHSVS